MWTQPHTANAISMGPSGKNVHSGGSNSFMCFSKNLKIPSNKMRPPIPKEGKLIAIRKLTPKTGKKWCCKWIVNSFAIYPPVIWHMEKTQTFRFENDLQMIVEDSMLRPSATSTSTGPHNSLVYKRRQRPGCVRPARLGRWLAVSTQGSKYANSTLRKMNKEVI